MGSWGPAGTEPSTSNPSRVNSTRGPFQEPATVALIFKPQIWKERAGSVLGEEDCEIDAHGELNLTL